MGIFDLVNFFNGLVDAEAPGFRRRSGYGAVVQPNMFENDRAAIVEIYISRRQLRVVVCRNLLARRF
jgi:hypothetical protein